MHLRVHACKSIRASHGTGDDGVWKASKVRLDRARAHAGVGPQSAMRASNSSSGGERARDASSGLRSPPVHRAGRR